MIGVIPLDSPFCCGPVSEMSKNVKGQYSQLVDLMLRGRIYSFMTRTLNLSLLNLRSRNSSQMQKSKSSILNRKRRRKYSTVLREQPRNVAG